MDDNTDKIRTTTAGSHHRVAALIVALAVALSACGSDEPPDVAAAQEQFCADVEEYVAALDTYGGLFADVDLSVGEVREAGEALDPGREAVLESAEVFRQAVEADPTAGVTIEIVEPETLTAVEDADAAFADAVDGINDRTPVTEAAVSFTSAAYGLQVAWVRVFADAGCIAEEDTALASQWVSDYVSALQTDLQTLGYYSGSIDGIYGPQTLAAVEEFQEANGLPVTGLPDPATQTALQTALEGRASAQVAALQGILITLGYFPGPIDGQWTPQLEEALKAFQTDLGVPATGTVDTATMRAFEEALAAEGQPPATTVAPAPEPEPDPDQSSDHDRRAADDDPPAGDDHDATTAAGHDHDPRPAGGLLDVLADAGGFTQLLAAIETAGLTERLSGPGPFTLFAPTDEAFAQLGSPLPDDPAELEALLLYHVVEDELTGFELAEVSTITPAGGGSISVAVDQGLVVLNGASTVTISNVVAGNGLAHVVNAVLAPSG